MTKSTVASDGTGSHLLPDPRDDLVEGVRERDRGLESEDLLRLRRGGDTMLHVVWERPIRDVAEWLVPEDLRPDEPCQLQNRGRRVGRKVEIVVQGSLRLHGQTDPA